MTINSRGHPQARDVVKVVDPSKNNSDETQVEPPDGKAKFLGILFKSTTTIKSNRKMELEKRNF